MKGSRTRNDSEVERIAPLLHRNLHPGDLDFGGIQIIANPVECAISLDPCSRRPSTRKINFSEGIHFEATGRVALAR